MPRYSSNEDDPGYQHFAAACRAGKRVEVLLEGHPVSDCTVADEEKGEVVFSVRDERGQYRTSDGEFVMETRYGKVEVRLR